MDGCDSFFMFGVRGRRHVLEHGGHRRDDIVRRDARVVDSLKGGLPWFRSRVFVSVKLEANSRRKRRIWLASDL